MRTILIGGFLAFSLLPVAFAQGTGPAQVSVKIADPQGAGVVGATIRLYSRDQRVRLVARTDATGRYRFEQLSPGEYLIDAEAPGFARAGAGSIRLEAGESRELELTLDIAAFREEVVVTASGTVQTVDEISKAVTNVDMSEIDERDEFAIPDALRTVPGLRVQQLGGPGAFVSIKTRGLRNEDTAILLDGMRFRDVAAPQGDATAFLQDLVVTDLDRVEVLRGSSSSLYGTNAIGGVINIVSRDGGGRPRGSLFTEGGSMGFFRARGQTSGGTDGDRLTYSAGVSYLNVARGVDGDDAARNTSGQGRVNFRLTPDANLSARFYASDASVMLNENPQTVGAIPPVGVIDAEPLSSEELERYESGTPIEDLNLDGANFIPSANDPDNDQDSVFVSMLVSFEQRPRDRFGYSIRYHGLSTDRTLNDGPRGVTFFEPIAASRSDFNGQIHTLNARADIGGGAHHFVTAGYELENESFFSRAADGFTESDVEVSQRSHTFVIQDQVRLMAGALQLSGAFRTQLFHLGDPVFSPPEGSPYQGVELDSPHNAYTGDGSAAYFFRDSGTKVRAHVGNGYRAPSLYERFGAFFSSFGYSNYGDPRLEPESSVAFDAGLDQDFANQQARVSATFFYTRLRKIIIFDFSGAIDPATDPFGRFGGYRRVDGGRAQGLELSATAARGGLRLGASYTFTDAEPPTEGFDELVQAYGIPRHQFTIVATQRIGKNLYVNADLALSDSYLAPVFDTATFASRAYRFDGIRKADLGASYTWSLSRGGNLRFFAKVDNLFDQDYYENGFRTVRRMGYGGVAFEF